MDDIDRAQEVIEQNISSALKNREVDKLADTGICHYCSDPIEKGHFCDSDCRDDYQQLNRK